MHVRVCFVYASPSLSCSVIVCTYIHSGGKFNRSRRRRPQSDCTPDPRGIPPPANLSAKVTSKALTLLRQWGEDDVGLNLKGLLGDVVPRSAALGCGGFGGAGCKFSCTCKSFYNICPEIRRAQIIISHANKPPFCVGVRF